MLDMMPEHGTDRRYWRGCRCDDCKAANSEYNRKRYSNPTPTDDHGTNANFGRGCRCDECTAARREYDRKQHSKRTPTDTHGTRTNYQRGCRCDECKAVQIEYDRKRREANRDESREQKRLYREANLDKLREYRRKYYKANRERALEEARKWAEANPDRVRENLRKWYEENSDKVAEDSRRWREANPDKRRAIGVKGQQIRRARKLNAFIEYVDRQAVFERDGWTCHICGEAVDPERKFPDPLSVSVDHIIPFAAGAENGGVESYDNVATAHLGCNASKGARMPA